MGSKFQWHKIFYLSINMKIVVSRWFFQDFAWLFFKSHALWSAGFLVFDSWEAMKFCWWMWYCDACFSSVCLSDSCFPNWLFTIKLSDLDKLGGLVAVVRELHSSVPEIRKTSAWVLGKASQNNALVQNQVNTRILLSSMI